MSGDRGEAIDDGLTAGNWQYDANGNTTRTPRQQELGYSFDRQPVYVDMGGGTEVRYLRHGDQRVVRLVKKTGVQALGVYLGPWEYHQRTGTNARTKLVLQVRGVQRHAQAEVVLDGTDSDAVDLLDVHTDHLGSGHVLMASDGTLLSQEEFLPYGRSADRRDERNRYRWLGVERDEATGLMMTQPRTYDPVVGRFLQGDPMVQPGKAVFGYASGNPVGRSDPGGYLDQPPPMADSDEARLVATCQQHALAGAARHTVESANDATSFVPRIADAAWSRLTGAEPSLEERYRALKLEARAMILESVAEPHDSPSLVALSHEAGEFIGELAAAAVPSGGAASGVATAVRVVNLQSARRRLLGLLKLRERVMELAVDTKQGVIVREGMGGVRFELKTGRRTTRSDDAAVEFVDMRYGAMDLKGPMSSSDSSRFDYTEDNVHGLARSVLDECQSTASDTVLVDLLGLTARERAYIKHVVNMGSNTSTTPVIFLE